MADLPPYETFLPLGSVQASVSVKIQFDGTHDPREPTGLINVLVVVSSHDYRKDDHAPAGRRLRARFSAAITAPVASLDQVPAARDEVDRVLDSPVGTDRVTSLTQSRTPVLLGEIADLVRSRAELRDPRLQALFDYDQEREAALVDTLEQYLQRFGDVRAAAADMHVHPNTLRYRVRRAEEILGMSLDDPDSRLLLQIQLLIRHPIR